MHILIIHYIITKIPQYNNLSATSENNLFLFLENLKLEIVDRELSPRDISNNRIKISNLSKEHDFNSVYLDGNNIGLYLIVDFDFFEDFFDREDLRNIISKCDLNQQNKDGWNIFIRLLTYNKEQEL